jgi:hypothetical protein
VNFSDFFFPCQIFSLPFRFHRDSSRVYAPGGDAVQEEPQQLDCTHPRKCSRYPPDRRSLARLCRCESSPSTPSRSPSIPRFWNSTQYQDSRIHYGKGRPASPHGDPHYHHGIMKESSPDVPILFCMSNTGSTAAQRNIGVGSAPNRPKRNLKHTNEGDVVVALSTHVWAHRHPPAPTCTHLHLQLHPHLRPANWGSQCQSAPRTCSLRLDVSRGHSQGPCLSSRYHSRIRAKSFEP